MHTNCTVPYGEVDGMSALLGYQTANAAGCKVTFMGSASCELFTVRILWCHLQAISSSRNDGNAVMCFQVLIHPRWGTSVYPATLFTKAPVTVLKKIIEEVEAETTDTGYYQSFMSI